MFFFIIVFNGLYSFSDYIAYADMFNVGVGEYNIVTRV